MTAKTISRETILQEIESCLYNGWGNNPFNPYFAKRNLEYLQHAETLIELLEVADCGSIGGFGEKLNKKGQLIRQQDKDNRPDLKSRYRWLKNMPLAE